MEKYYVQYGCGLCAPDGWLNFDASPTLRLQKIPLLGGIFRKTSGTLFPRNARFGDIRQGLKTIKDNSCTGVYCSHTLEHLSLEDCRKAIAYSYAMLKPGGVFRLVLPDLEFLTKKYLEKLASGDATSSIAFMGRETLLGVEKRPMGVMQVLKRYFGNSHHLWMWDYSSLSMELKNAGFKNIRRCKFNDSSDEMFKLVEAEDRFINQLAIECYK